MHEIGVLMEVVKTVEKFSEQNNVEKIEKLVLQIGELSSMIPKYMQSLYTAAVDGSILEGSKLEIEILPANGLCKDCEKVFNIVVYKGICPECKTNNWDLLSGKEFNIKEIICY